jgi:UDP-galactopyranose mutase
MTYSIVGGGLAGCVLASLLPDSVIYERNRVGGLCQDNDNYQDFIHVLHTNYEDVWNLFRIHTTIKPHNVIQKSYYDSDTHPYPPKELTDDIFQKGYIGYSKKMWKSDNIPPEAKSRIITSPDGYLFHEKYQGVPDFKRLFDSLTHFTQIIKMDVRDGDLDGPTILTGAIDEYFNYCYGKLPYRGMQSVHYKSEIGLDADLISFSDEKIPFQRLVDYGRLGYNDTWIGVESACDAKHYPVRTEESEKTYNKYKKLADKKGVLLCGRLATYHYQNMDEVVMSAINLARLLCKSK